MPTENQSVDNQYDAGDMADQACKHGQRCGHHAVYCCNESWPEAPRKCRRAWYTGGEVRDEDCAGFEPRQQAEVKL